MSDSLTLAERDRVEQVLLRALRSRYPGRAIRVDWDESDTVSNFNPATAGHDDCAEDAA